MSEAEPPHRDRPFEIVIDGFGTGTPGHRENAIDFGRTPPTAATPAGRVPPEEQTVVQKTFDERRQLLEKASSQIVDDSGLNFGLDGVVEHPFNMDALIKLNEMSVVRRACINAIATNVARLGYRIKKTDPGAEEQDSDEVSEQIIDFLEKWARQDRSSFSDLIYKVKFDEESCGNGYIEVTRDRVGRVAGLHYVPAQTIFIKRDRSGFVQRVGTREVGFYNFGDKYTVDASGQHTLKPDRDSDVRELIHFKMHASGSQFYGLPRDIAAITTIYGDELARNSNTKFFTHAATPELLLIFEVDKAAIPQQVGSQPIKVSIPEGVKKEIEDHFRRTLSSNTFKPGIFHLPPGVKLKIERLSSEQKDAGWINFRKENRNELRIAFQTPPVIIADTGDGSNYATALAEKSVYLEQVIEPEQRKYQGDLMWCLWPELVKVKPPETPMEIDEDGDSTIPKQVDIKPKEGTGINPHIWKLEFLRMTIADQATLAQIHNIYGTLGVDTVNEIRSDRGKKPVKGGDKAPQPPGGGEGNAQAQNADMKQVAAGNPDLDKFVSNPMQQDIVGMGKRLGGGRGPNGTSSLPVPRRPFDTSSPRNAAFGTTGQPIRKSDETVEIDGLGEMRVININTYDKLIERLEKAERLNEELQGELGTGADSAD